MNVNISVVLKGELVMRMLRNELSRYSSELEVDALSFYLTDLTESIILDLHKLNAGLTQNLCIKGYPTDDFIFQVSKLLPNQITLVSKSSQTTSIFSEDYDEKVFAKWKESVSHLECRGILTSVLVELDIKQIKAASLLGVDRVLMDISCLGCDDFDNCVQLENLQKHIDYARSLGLSVNLCGGLDSRHIRMLNKKLSNIKEFAWDKTITT